jgi:hypothetical protein
LKCGFQFSVFSFAFLKPINLYRKKILPYLPYPANLADPVEKTPSKHHPFSLAKAQRSQQMQTSVTAKSISNDFTPESPFRRQDSDAS